MSVSATLSITNRSDMNSGRVAIIPTLLTLSFFALSIPSFADTISTPDDDAPIADTGASFPKTDPALPVEDIDTKDAVILPTVADEPTLPEPGKPAGEPSADSVEVVPESDPSSAHESLNEPASSAEPPVEIPASEPKMTPPVEETPTEIPLGTEEADTPPPAGRMMMAPAMLFAADSPPDTIISEVQIAGDDANDDFVELYNPGDAAYSLKGFELRRKTKGDSTPTGSLFHAFSDSDSIPGNGYFLWANKDGTAAFIAIADVISKNKTSPALTTDNSLALFNSSKTMIAALAWGSGHTKPFTASKNTNPGKNQSLVYDADKDSWSISDCPTPTNSKGETPDPSPACKDSDPPPPIGTIVINEFLPYPNAGEEEWIELRNTGVEEIKLAGWKIQDASGKTYAFPKATVIAAGGFLVIDGSTSSIALNNAGAESVILLFPDGSTADSISYDGTDQNVAFARTDTGTFLQTHTPTRGAINVFDPEPEKVTPPPIGTVIINEFLPYPNAGEEEWIELRNTGDTEISLAGWTMKDASSSAGYTFPAGTVIVANGFFILGAETSLIALNNTGAESVTLSFPDKSVADTYSYDGTGQGATYARTDTGTFLLTHIPTPKATNTFDPEPEKVTLPPVGTVIINELFPNPAQKGEENEWIELRNTGNIPIGLVGWILRSGSGKFTWTNDLSATLREISANGYLVIDRALSKLALRNTDGAVTLLASDDMTTMDSVSYGTAIEEASYGRTLSGTFRWSTTLTPGYENVFGTEPKAKKVSIPKQGYVNAFIPFSTDGNKKNLKYVWDFGDGHKSYLDTTSHRYEKTGTYEGTLTTSDRIEETVRTFTIRIEKYPRRDLHLTELAPNPSGTDTGAEWIRIRNDDVKKINLSGWIIATGSDKEKLVNHVITSNRSLAPGEEIALTHDDAKFTLPNRQAIIELRRPDGKTVQTVSYDVEKDVAENVIYTEVGDDTWTWSVPSMKDVDIAPAPEETTAETVTDTAPYEPGLSVDPDSDRLTFGEFVSLGTPYDPDLPDALPRVLGASDERLRSDMSSSESFLDSLFRALNGFMTGTT